MTFVQKPILSELASASFLVDISDLPCFVGGGSWIPLGISWKWWVVSPSSKLSKPCGSWGVSSIVIGAWHAFLRNLEKKSRCSWMIIPLRIWLILGSWPWPDWQLPEILRVLLLNDKSPADKLSPSSAVESNNQAAFEGFQKSSKSGISNVPVVAAEFPVLDTFF